MTLRQIQYVVEAERQGSLSSAAKALFISQSTLSFAIKELEREIGMVLFERSRSGIKATEDGRAFLTKARQALSAVNELENVGNRAKIPVSRLRVATVQSGMVPVALSQVVAQLEGEDASMRLQCRMGETSEIIDAVTEGQCDVGFIYATERQEKLWRSLLGQKGLRCSCVFEGELFIILNAEDTLAQQESLDLSQLGGHTFVFSGDGGLEGFSNLTDYSMQNFDLNGHRRYVDAQDSMLLNYLLHTTRSFSIGHRSPRMLGYDGLAFVPIRRRQYVRLLAVTPVEQSVSGEMEVLLRAFEMLAAHGKQADAHTGNAQISCNGKVL